MATSSVVKSPAVVVPTTFCGSFFFFRAFSGDLCTIVSLALLSTKTLINAVSSLSSDSWIFANSIGRGLSHPFNLCHSLWDFGWLRVLVRKLACVM